MPCSDIIVIGASAGGVEALRVLVSGLPAGLRASIFIVLHIGSHLSQLHEILSRVGGLRAVQASEGEQFQEGRIYTAPPDCHMLLEDGRIHLSRGPKENRTRPAINPLFRSAAAVYGSRVVGVLLTGMLDDGVAGLAEIKRRAGVAVVQDPTSALYPSMPAAAIRRVSIDHILPLEQIPDLLVHLTNTKNLAMSKHEPVERNLVGLLCPDCQGPISEERQGGIIEYTCRVGHKYSPLSMLVECREAVERSLWKSVVSLEAAADVAEFLAPEIGAHVLEEAHAQRKRAAAIKDMIETDVAPPLESESSLDRTGR